MSPSASGEIADVGERQRRRIDPVEGMRAVHQHPARLCGSPPDRTWCRCGWRCRVERNAGDADRRVAIPARDAEECRRDGIGGGRRHGATGGNCETEHRGRDRAGPVAIGRAFRRRGDRKAVDDEIAQFVDALALVPGGIGIEFDAEGGGQHGGGEILDIVAHLRRPTCRRRGARRYSRNGWDPWAGRGRSRRRCGGRVRWSRTAPGRRR